MRNFGMWAFIVFLGIVCMIALIVVPIWLTIRALCHGRWWGEEETADFNAVFVLDERYQ